jgi:sugar-specific transcriptional regulator TrmB
MTKKSVILTNAIEEDAKNEFLINTNSLSEFKELCGLFSRFGFSKNEAKVYVYLAKFGKQKAPMVSRSISLHRTETYKILKRLEGKGLAIRILEKPIKYAAIPVNKALENLIQKKKQRVVHLEEEKQKILSSWDIFSITTKYSEIYDEFIQVLKGRNQIQIKINEIIENAKDEVLIAALDESLLQLFYSGALDDLAEKSNKIKIRLITDSFIRSSYIIKKLRLKEENFFRVEFKGLPSFIISQNHLLLFLDNESSIGKNSKRALWTNQKDLISILKASFSNLSSNKKILGIVT